MATQPTRLPMRLVLACVLAALLYLHLKPASTQASAAPPTAGWREVFARDLLARLGNPAPTDATVAFVVEWTIAEDVSDGAAARNNPLNTTQASAAETMTINEDGVRGYATERDGLDATVQTLGYGYYYRLVAALQANDPIDARQALWASPWASSHYGYGASWPRVE